MLFNKLGPRHSARVGGSTGNARMRLRQWTGNLLPSLIEKEICERRAPCRAADFKAWRQAVREAICKPAR
jgi:hypothetical protein